MGRRYDEEGRGIVGEKIKINHCFFYAKMARKEEKKVVLRRLILLSPENLSLDTRKYLFGDILIKALDS